MGRPTIEDAAKEILRVAVRDLHLKPDEVINARTVMDRFNILPWRPTDLQPALSMAVQLGWVTSEGKLTAVGHAAAPYY